MKPGLLKFSDESAASFGALFLTCMALLSMGQLGLEFGHLALILGAPMMIGAAIGLTCYARVQANLTFSRTEAILRIFFVLAMSYLGAFGFMYMIGQTVGMKSIIFFPIFYGILTAMRSPELYAAITLTHFSLMTLFSYVCVISRVREMQKQSDDMNEAIGN